MELSEMRGGVVSRSRGHRRGANEYATLSEACFAFFKGIVGPAVLYIPNGFADAGLGMALLIIGIANGLFILGMARLLDCWRYADREVNGVELAMELGGVRCAFIVKFCVVSLQLGVCVTYFIFISETLSDVWSRIEVLNGISPPRMPLCVAIVAVLEAPAATVRSLHRLATANIFGSFFVIGSLGIIVVYSLGDLYTHGPASDFEPLIRTQPKTSALFFAGIAVFAFEGGASMIIPIANSVSPENREALKPLLILCVIGISFFYSLFGTIVYTTYGKDVNVIASKVLEKGKKSHSFWPDGAVNAIYLFVVLLSFPLQLLPATQILFPKTASISQKPAPPLSAIANSSSRYHRIASHEQSEQNHFDHQPDDDSPTVVTFSPLTSSPNDLSPIESNSSPSQTQSDTSSMRKLQYLGHLQRVATVIALALLAVLGRHSLDHVVALLGAISCGPLALIIGPYLHYTIATTRLGRLFDISLMSIGALVTIMTLAVTLASWQSAQS